jgi:hypothetical protein
VAGMRVRRGKLAAMKRFTTEHCERRLSIALREVRDGFREALAGGGGNELEALGVRLRVDQARRLVVAAEATDVGGGGWMQRDGKAALATATREERARLARYVGRGRELTAAQAFGILCDVAGERPVDDVARVPLFVNLFVVEGALHLGWELAIWLTLARQLAVGDARGAELHGLLPPLVTDFDPFYRELAVGDAESLERLKPARRGGRSSWPEYQMRLLGEVIPELAVAAQAQRTGDERRELFQAQTPRLLDYVRDEVFARVARALEDETKVS